MNNPFRKVDDQEIVDFAKNLSLMLKSGINLSQALREFSDRDDLGKLAEITADLEEEVRSGTPFPEALSKHENVFGGIFIGLVKAGEESGSLAETVASAAKWLKRNSDLKNTISNATLYPKFLLAAALIVGGAVSVYVLPKIIPVFGQLGVELPWTTQLLVSFSNFLQSFWWLVIAGFAAALISYRMLKRLQPVRRFLDNLFLKIPFVSSFFRDYQLALFCHILAVLLQSGISIKNSLDVASESVTNMAYAESIQRAKNKVLQGTPLSEALSNFERLFPDNVISIISTGEESGELAATLEYLADYYSDEVENTAERIPVILEPVILILIAIFVAFIAIAIIKPIYEVTRGFR